MIHNAHKRYRMHIKKCDNIKLADVTEKDICFYLSLRGAPDFILPPARRKKVAAGKPIHFSRSPVTRAAAFLNAYYVYDIRGLFYVVLQRVMNI